MTLDAFREHTMLVVARERNLPYHKDHHSLLHGLTYKEISKVVERSIGEIRRWKSQGLILPENKNTWQKVFEFGEIAKVMKQTGRVV